LKANNGSTSKPWLLLFLKPIIISSLLMLFQQMSYGASFILATVPIAETIAGKDIDLHTVSVVTAIVPLVALMISSNFVDRIGRRLLLLTSTTLMMLSALALGFCFYVQAGEEERVAQKLIWFRLLSFLTYIFGFSIGLGPISWLYLGELMPDRARGTLFNCFNS
jgi:facilitated trehalose transporter